MLPPFPPLCLQWGPQGPGDEPMSSSRTAWCWVCQSELPIVSPKMVLMCFVPQFLAYENHLLPLVLECVLHRIRIFKDYKRRLQCWAQTYCGWVSNHKIGRVEETDMKRKHVGVCMFSSHCVSPYTSKSQSEAISRGKFQCCESLNLHLCFSPHADVQVKDSLWSQPCLPLSQILPRDYPLRHC